MNIHIWSEKKPIFYEFHIDLNQMGPFKNIKTLTFRCYKVVIIKILPNIMKISQIFTSLVKDKTLQDYCN